VGHALPRDQVRPAPGQPGGSEAVTDVQRAYARLDLAPVVTPCALAGALRQVPDRGAHPCRRLCAKLRMGDTLLPRTNAVLDDPALTATALCMTATEVRVRVGGGVAGATYTLAVIVPTLQGSVLEITRTIEILP